MTGNLPALITSARTQIGNSMARSMMQNVVFVGPLLWTALAYFMLRTSGVPGLGEYVVTGAGLMALWNTILWSSATDVNRERWMGTFELLLIAPVPFPVTLLGKVLGNTLIGMGALALSLVYSRLLLGVQVPVAHPGRLALALAATLFSFVGFSLMLALLFTLSRQANTIANGLSYPIHLVSGLLFPLPALPGWLLPFGLALPLAWAREALRWAVVGQAGAAQLLTPSFAAALAGLLGLGAMYFAAAFGLYRWVVERKLRRLGQLGMA